VSLCVPVQLQSELYQAVIFSDMYLGEMFHLQHFNANCPSSGVQGRSSVRGLGTKTPAAEEFLLNLILKNTFPGIKRSYYCDFVTYVAVQFYRRGFIVAGTTMYFCDTNP